MSNNNARYKNTVKFLLLLICLGLLWYLGRFLHIDAEVIETSLGKSPVLYSAILYILLYVTVTFFVFFSKDIFWITGAVVFGAYLSTLLVAIAETINAFILFHLARYLGRSFVEHHLKRKSQTLDERVGNLNFFWLFIMRFVPLIPYRFLDLGIGLTKIDFTRYLAVVLLASPIRIFWVQYTLSVIGRAIFTKPELIVGYLLHNKALFVFSLGYLILIILLIRKLKYKPR